MLVFTEFFVSQQLRSCYGKYFIQMIDDPALDYLNWFVIDRLIR